MSADMLRVQPLRDGLPSRKISAETVRHYGYGGAVYRGRPVQVAPYHDPYGRLVGQKLRFPDKSFMVAGDASAMGLFGRNKCRDAGRMLVITEGEIDAMSVSQAMGNRWPAVSVPWGAKGSAAVIRAELEWLNRFDRVVFAFDSDDAGREGALELAQLLPPGRACVAQLPRKDPNEMLQAGEARELVDALWGAPEWRPDGIVKGLSSMVDIARRWRSMPSVPWPHEGLQRMTMGMRPGEVVTLVAGTKAGKSTLAFETVAHLMQEGVTCGVVALEGSFKDNLSNIVTPLVSRPLRFEDDPWSDPDVQEVAPLLDERLIMYNTEGRLDAESILSKIRFMVAGEGCRVVLLDNLSVVLGGSDGDDERRAVDRFMTESISMTKELGCTLLLVCHLKRTDGKSAEEGGRVRASDIRSSGLIEKLSSTVVAIERDLQEGTDAAVRLLLCRHTGLSGLAGHMQYDRETGRLTEAVSDMGFSFES